MKILEKITKMVRYDVKSLLENDVETAYNDVETADNDVKTNENTCSIKLSKTVFPTKKNALSAETKFPNTMYTLSKPMSELPKTTANYRKIML